MVMKHMVLAVALLLGAAASAQASPGRGRPVCTVEVLHSEELTYSPINYHLVRADLLVVPPDHQAFQTTVQKLIPWQAPPPRRGERVRFPCNSAAWRDFFADSNYSSLLGAFESVLSVGTVQ